MYLKALEMQGFKSFPDRTVLEFGKGVTAVVGPNGSGKSNISDAVRWVLGEQSTKNLRGAKMEDVIFSGTGERRAQGFAEVTLRLDNSDGALNSPENEVAVTRRYYRSGESAYMINSKAVRLKDVHELFMDTGLGRDGYSLVGQGRIEEMVSAKSENRRDMLEEAAGISHFRYRRADAVKRLGQTEENLVRLRDIVSELEARVGPLEKQSRRAQQFLVYAGERKELEIGLWARTLQRSAQQIREQSNRLSVARNQYDMTGHILEKLSADIDAAANGTRDINIELEKQRNEQRALEERAAALDAQAAVYENSALHNTQTIDRIKKDISVQSEDSGAVDAEQENARRQIEEQTKKTEEGRRLLSGLMEKLGELKKNDEAYSGEYNEISQRLSDIAGRLSQTDIMISSSDSYVKEINARIEAIESVREEKTELLKGLFAESEKIHADTAAMQNKIEELSNIAAGFELRGAKLRKKLEALKDRHEKKRLELLSDKARLKFLEDTEKNMEGYQGSVKAVMRDASRGILSGIRGTVIQLIEVPEKYQTAIETALGNAGQDIITETENDAKRAINSLKRSGAGRATFMPMSAVRGRELSETGLEACRGYVGLASELCSCPEEYREIIKSLLGRIAVAEDLDIAVEIAKKYAYRFKIVTLDGQLVNAGGSMTGGSAVKNSGFLARRAEAQRLSASCAEGERELSQTERELNAAEQSCSKESAQLRGVLDEKSGKNEQLLRKQSEAKINASRTEQIKADIAELENEKAAAAKRAEYFTENVSAAGLEREKLSAQKLACEKELAQLSGGRDSLLTERERINAEISQVNLSMAEAMKEIEAKKESILSLEKRREAISHRKEELEAELSAINAENAALGENAEKSRAAAALLREEKDGVNGIIEQLLEKRDEFEKSVTAARGEEKLRSEEREKLGAELVRLEERKAALEKEQADTEKRLFEEYSLTRREALETAAEIESVSAAQKRLSELKGLIKALGNVNVAAIDEYKEVSSRYEFLSGQVNDVEKSKKELLKMIDELTVQMAQLFRERFNAINQGFKETFTQLFSGGSAELVLEDENDILECGIDIKAQPPGKNVKSLTLLSGGEKGLTAIALLFAILKVRPAPFCIFDEVEAALDDVNVLRYAQYVRMMTGETQFILITHRRGTMEEADVLYGVTMQEHGVSKLLELKTAEMVEKLKLQE